MRPKRYLLINDGSSKFISKKFTVESFHYSDRVGIKRINYFIGKNNSGKSLFLRWAFSNRKPITPYFTSTEYIDDYYQSTCVDYRDVYPVLPNSKPTNQDQLEKLMDLIREIHGNQDYWINLIEEEIKKGREIDERYEIDDLVVEVEVDYFLKFTKISDIIEPIEEFYRNTIDQEDIYLHRKFYKKRIDKISNTIKEINTQFKSGRISPVIDNIVDRLQQIREKILDMLNKPLPEKYYIPTLRGMRPIKSEPNQLPYRNRTKQDYFADREHINIENILTGESLYTHIQQQLLGKPQGRQTIQKYQEKLSQYFFNNLEVTLIPELESDMLCIKIGEDEQFPVAQLGDGLQQVIILTYHAFTQQDAVCSFFIEEPELHMHPGMLRQLMNFYLNETKHYYFFTTHSNHLLDMADESNEVMIQKFVKKSPDQFHIYRCGRDRDLLQSLGVRPSSVYLANCTIWVEGITDRLYLAKYMEKYLRELEQSDAEAYRRYRRFMPNYHYAFVEYSGGNIVHWHFGEEFVSQNQDKGMNAKAVVSDMLLIADGDNLGKAKRVEGWTKELTKQNVYILPCKEIENTLPFKIITSVATEIFGKKQARPTKRFNPSGFSINKLNNLTDEEYFFNKEFGIGKLLDNQIKNNNRVKRSFFSDSGVGTIADKLNFCHAVLNEMDNHQDWQLTPSARDLCERIFQHIERNNDEAQ